jgi:molecular chaperone DnaK
MSRLIGIDLGTTNSCVAVMEGGRPVVIANAEGSRTTPSVVAFSKKGERLVGEVAKRQAAMNPERTISSIKRQMGSTRSVQIDRKNYLPQEISAIILDKLKRDAEKYLGETVIDAVITVPAYFTDAQRQATKDAGTIAGLNVQRIVNEPTAAALAYGVDKEENKAVMVYDLGGGTFDVSILSIQGGVIEVLATAGDNQLGGDDFDKRLTDELLRRFKSDTGVDVSRDHAAMNRLVEAAETAKKDLSSVSTTSINLPFLASSKGQPVHFETQVTRAQFEKMTADLVERTMEPCRRALHDAHMNPGDIGKVLMVGGSSRIPAVKLAVKNLTGKDPSETINPDESVAMGACLQAGVLSGDVGGLLLLDVTPHSLGIEVVNDCMSVLIARNSTLPTMKSDIYTTVSPMQTTVEINVLQGESQRASENTSLGKFRLGGLRLGMNKPQIEVTFQIDANGIVHVTAKDLGTNKAANISIEGSSNMSQRQIEAASKRLTDGK